MTFLTELERLKAAATQCKDVDVSWYEFKLKDGSTIHEPQFETETGLIAQEEEDYELYCFLRNHADAIAEVVRAIEQRAHANNLWNTANTGDEHAHAHAESLKAEKMEMDALAKLEGK